jgi:CheY-like chemotaxis protein
MERQKARVLFIDDNPNVRATAKDMFEREFKDFEFTIVSNIDEALKAVKQEKFNAIITDIRFDKPSAISPVEFLKQCERRFPKTRLVVFSGIDPKERLKGLRFIGRNQGFRKIGLFLKFLRKKPWKTTCGEMIDLRQFIRPILHISPSGKKELLELVNANPNDTELQDRLRQGWRPLNRERTLAKTRHSKQHYSVHGGEPLPGSIFDIHGQWERKAITALKRKPK